MKNNHKQKTANPGLSSGICAKPVWEYMTLALRALLHCAHSPYCASCLPGWWLLTAFVQRALERHWRAGTLGKETKPATAIYFHFFFYSRVINPRAVQENAECPPQEVRVWCGPQPLAPPAANPTLPWRWAAGLAKHWEKLCLVYTNCVTAEVRHKNVKEYKYKIWWHQRQEKINFLYREEGISQSCWRWSSSWSCHFPASGYHSDFHTRHMSTPWCHSGASTGHGQLVPPAEHYSIYNLDWGKIISHPPEK